MTTGSREGDTNPDSDSEENATLLTQKAFQLSLSPPRCPPFDTAHRSVLMGNNPSSSALVAEQHGLQQSHAHSNYNHHTTIKERVELLVYNAHSSITHPHLSVGPEFSDKVLRFLGTILPLDWQNHCRDMGGFRDLSDTLVQYSIPVGAVANPKAAMSFLSLTKQCQSIQYGKDESQFIDIFFPTSSSSIKTTQNNNNHSRTNDNGCGYDDSVDGMVFFVHGGAWGSGKPWFYRLCALPFLKLNLAVAIVGYRVYPSGDVNAQVCDLEAAFQKLSKEYPTLVGPNRTKRDIGLVVMGHSSGAHIGFLMIVEQLKRLLLVKSTTSAVEVAPLVDKFVGISGPYDISHHFDYEAARGVEELSPMKAANGHTREQFRANTPQWRLKEFLASTLSPELEESSVDDFFPPSLFVHGIEDDTVPFTATSEAANIVRSCGVTRLEEFYAPLTGHQDAVMHLMLGGRVERGIVDWLRRKPLVPLMRSRL